MRTTQLSLPLLQPSPSSHPLEPTNPKPRMSTTQDEDKVNQEADEVSLTTTTKEGREGESPSSSSIFPSFPLSVVLGLVWGLNQIYTRLQKAFDERICHDVDFRIEQLQKLAWSITSKSFRPSLPSLDLRFLDLPEILVSRRRSPFRSSSSLALGF